MLPDHGTLTCGDFDTRIDESSLVLWETIFSSFAAKVGTVKLPNVDSKMNARGKSCCSVAPIAYASERF